MNNEEYSNFVTTTWNNKLEKKDQILNATLGLNGECAEYSELIKKHFFHGHDLDRKKALSELGDALYYLNISLHLHGSSMEEIQIMNMEKLTKRYPSGFCFNDSKARIDVIKC